MKILALEFSSAQRSVAVVGTAVPAATAPRAVAFGVEAVETGAQATNAFALIERVLREAQVAREQVDCLAVGLGPGSYTGIRAALAVAQGWQLARPVQVLGLSAAECLAAQAHEAGLTGHASVVIDAQRGEFYLAGYELDADGWREREPLRLASQNDVHARAAAGELLLGPEVLNTDSRTRRMFPRALTLGRLAAGRLAAGGGKFQPAERLEPIYLRETTFVKGPPPRVLPP
jgi:tRNA threonylcarbamoyl adenosine modification protein YeaZ